MNSNAIRIAAVAIGILAIIGALVLRGGGDGGSSSTTIAQPEPAVPATEEAPAEPATTAPADAIRVSIAYSPEKADLMVAAIGEFNALGTQVGGRPVFVEGERVSSGASFDRLRDGSLQPVVWSPASSLWGRLLTQVADVAWVPERSPSLARTPLVIGMWEPEARALGWPDKELGWSDVLAAAQNPDGWAAFGHPEWGSFRLGHTNPDFSTSGLSAVVAEYYAATGKTEGLTLADVEGDAAREKVRGIQSSVVHYGDTTVFFADQLAAKGRAFASAVALEETTVVDFNAKKRARDRLVAIYPKEGTFFSDNPLIVLDAPWVAPEQKEGAQAFVDYLLSAQVQDRVGEFGLRPGDSTKAPGPAISEANGADPSLPKRVLSLPEPRVLARIKELWREDRKPADIAVVLDVSGSMYDEGKLEQAQEGLLAFLGQLSPRDRVALVVFSDEPQLVQPLTALATSRSALEERIAGLIADGGTAVYDAAAGSVQLVERDGDPKRIRATVVLTDGIDNRSSAGLGDVIALAGRNGGEGNGIRMFTIAYGSEADVDGLKRLAEAYGGKAYVGDPDSIRSVYTQISSFF